MNGRFKTIIPSVEILGVFYALNQGFRSVKTGIPRLNLTRLKRIMKARKQQTLVQTIQTVSIGGITMSTLSSHPVEYLKLHVHYEEIRTRLLSSVGSVVKKVFNSSEQAAAITVVLLTVGLVILACMKIIEFAEIAAGYEAVITEMVLPPL